ncbi:MAG: hypothetical protein WCE94_00660 [Candidatus Methanoperedens sp.]
MTTYTTPITIQFDEELGYCAVFNQKSGSPNSRWIAKVEGKAIEDNGKSPLELKFLEADDKKFPISEARKLEKKDNGKPYRDVISKFKMVKDTIYYWAIKDRETKEYQQRQFFRYLSDTKIQEMSRREVYETFKIPYEENY